MEGEIKVKFLVLGVNGMAGHMIALYLKEQGHQVEGFARTQSPFITTYKGDACDFSVIETIVAKGEFDALVNCIGILNQRAEDEKYEAVLLNSALPHHLASLTKNTKTKVIHLSTDCVFSGKTGRYAEDSPQDGATFYDRSKAMGELNDAKNLTFRNSIIGPDVNPNGIGLFHWFMKQTGEISGYSKAIWCGVSTLTLAKAIEKAVADDLTGLYHLCYQEAISKYALLQIWNAVFRNNQLIIHENSSFTLDKSMLNTRNDFDFVVPSYEKMAEEQKSWMKLNKHIYPYQ